MNRIDFDSVYKNLLDLEGLLLLIKEREGDAPDELLSHFKERLMTLCCSFEVEGGLTVDCENPGENVESSVVDSEAKVPSGDGEVDICHAFDGSESDVACEHVACEEYDGDIDASAGETRHEQNDSESMSGLDCERIALNAEFEEEEEADELGREVVDADSPIAPDVVRVGDVIPHQGQSDLRRSFTLNDRFRFRRELFGNNDNEFADALNLVSAMNSLSEAEEYFYDDLGWDASNEEVKEFISIISRHFNGKR